MQGIGDTQGKLAHDWNMRGWLKLTEKRFAASSKSEVLKVTKASACPFNAVSNTISSLGSESCGRYK